MKLIDALVALPVERLNSIAYFYGIPVPDCQDGNYSQSWPSCLKSSPDPCQCAGCHERPQ